jgi:urease accessory protein
MAPTLMQHAWLHCPAGHWPEERAAGSLTLDFDARHRRRSVLTSDEGELVLLDLPRAVAMADGDGLQLEDGRWLKVQAASEVLVEVTHGDPDQLVRIAWHLGNRHLPTEIRYPVLRTRPDHVVEQMLVGFGAHVATVHAVFRPESAYGGQAPHDLDDRAGSSHE